MGLNNVNGLDFEKMIRAGLNNLKIREREINALNVFPVADGDTGTNMRLTIENGLKKAESNAHFGKYLVSLSDGMLLGARGNSGVILSQLFKGLSNELLRDSIVNAREFLQGFTTAYRQAYKAVVVPVEGTILTVAREGAENTKKKYFRGISIETFFEVYLSELKLSLENTPNLLGQLKEAGVVDSGGVGYVTIIEGMLKSLLGENIEVNENDDLVVPQVTLNEDSFTNSSVLSNGYCMEFLLQLQDVKHADSLYREKKFISDLKIFGNSIEVVTVGSRVKVHIHTLRPGKIIDLAQEYGEFIQFKLENMDIQAEEVIKEKEESKLPHKVFGIISVAQGDGFEELYKGLDADIVIKSGDTMNTSSGEFLMAINRINCDKVVILPNNSNVIKAAKQAKELYKGDSEVTIVETKNLVEGYYSLAMSVNDPKDADYTIRSIEKGSEGVVSLEFAKACKEYKGESFKCKTGDYISILNNNLYKASQNFGDMFRLTMSGIETIGDMSSCIVFKGRDYDESYDDVITHIMNEINPDIEVNFVDGGESSILVIGLI